jgi:hypothetical protein
MSLLLPQQNLDGEVVRPGMVFKAVRRDRHGFSGLVTFTRPASPQSRRAPDAVAFQPDLTMICRLAKQAHRRSWKYRKAGFAAMEAYCKGVRDGYLQMAILIRPAKGKAGQ